MSREPIKAVHVSSNNDGDEYYEVGRNDVTVIEWDGMNGHMATLDTIKVFNSGQLHSEHPFCNVLGVYYATQPSGNSK
jgi:hypothetical protein